LGVRLREAKTRGESPWEQGEYLSLAAQRRGRRMPAELRARGTSLDLGGFRAIKNGRPSSRLALRTASLAGVGVDVLSGERFDERADSFS